MALAPVRVGGSVAEHARRRVREAMTLAQQAPEPTPAAPEQAQDARAVVRDAVKRIRARKREQRAEHAEQTDDAPDTRPCAGCSEPLSWQSMGAYGRWFCGRDACRCTHGDDECHCEPADPTYKGMKPNMPAGVTARSHADRIASDLRHADSMREQAEAEAVANAYAGADLHVKGYGTVTLCLLPCRKQHERTPKDKPAYMAKAHKHERGTAGTFAVRVNATAALTDLVGEGMTGETHFVREADARDAYSAGCAWLRNGTVSAEAIRERKAERKQEREVQYVLRRGVEAQAHETTFSAAARRALGGA